MYVFYGFYFVFPLQEQFWKLDQHGSFSCLTLIVTHYICPLGCLTISDYIVLCNCKYFGELSYELLQVPTEFDCNHASTKAKLIARSWSLKWKQTTLPTFFSCVCWWHGHCFFNTIAMVTSKPNLGCFKAPNSILLYNVYMSNVTLNMNDKSRKGLQSSRRRILVTQKCDQKLKFIGSVYECANKFWILRFTM